MEQVGTSCFGVFYMVSISSSVFEVLFISKSLERVCDHAVNISKEIFFIATSRDVRHAPEYKKAALRRDLK